MCDAHGMLKASDCAIPVLIPSTIGLKFSRRLVSPFSLRTGVLDRIVLIPRSLVFQYFENLIIKKECDANMTLFENRMHALSNYFETACIAGPWSADTVFDYQLSTLHLIANICECNCTISNVYLFVICARCAHRFDAESKYRNLCAACERPASCYNTDKYYGREGALMCLTDGMGDVAWIRLGDAKVHFKVN